MFKRSKEATLIFFLIFFIFKGGAQISLIKDENLKTSILSQVDLNKDGELDPIEIDSTTSLSCVNINIIDLDGLEQFKNLHFLNLRNNKISNYKAVNELSNLKELIINNNPKIDSINLDQLTNLQYLGAENLGLKSLIINSVNVKKIYAGNNNFLQFNTLHFPELLVLNLENCKNLKLIDVTSNFKLQGLYVSNTGIENLDISKNTNLNVIYVDQDVHLIKNKNQKELMPSQVVFGN